MARSPLRRPRSGHRRDPGKNHADQETPRFPGLLTDLVAAYPQIGKSMSSSTTSPPTSGTTIGWRPTPMSPFTSPRPRQAGSIGWKSVRYLQPKGSGRGQLCQHRPAGPGDRRLHRSLQPQRHTLCLAQARGQGRPIAQYYRQPLQLDTSPIYAPRKYLGFAYIKGNSVWLKLRNRGEWAGSRIGGLDGVDRVGAGVAERGGVGGARCPAFQVTRRGRRSRSMAKIA